MKSNFLAAWAETALLSTILLIPIATGVSLGMMQQVKQDITPGVIGEVNPAVPVQIKVWNATPIALSMGAAGSASYRIAPNHSLSTKISILPTSSFVYAAITHPYLCLNYYVSLNGNQVMIQVQQVSRDIPEDGAITIHQNGHRDISYSISH